MAKLESIIRKKVLEARPSVKGPDWAEMEQMLAGLERKRRPAGWLFLTDLGILLMFGWMFFCVSGNHPENHDHPPLPPVVQTPVLTPPAEVKYGQTSPIVSSVVSPGVSLPVSPAVSLPVSPVVSEDTRGHFVVPPIHTRPRFLSRSIFPPKILTISPLLLTNKTPQLQTPVYTPPPPWSQSRWALEVHLNNVHAPVYWGQDSVKKFFSNYNSPGIGISFLRRRSARFTWGIRFDLDVPSYPVDTSPDDPFAYSRMWGGGWDMAFFMRQYRNDDPTKRFRVYWQAGFGYNLMGMNAYNISRIDNPYDDPKTQWILRKSRLEEASINFFPWETYMHMTTSGGIGAELRLYRRLSLTMGSIVHANMLINKDRLNNPDQYWGYDYYIKHSMGLQYGF
ncbi:MAG: hypothetical protein SF052_20195 [Bacteroidia bacterium]|nr:hypothetical protein [Bacteroidia bacterium]